MSETKIQENQFLTPEERTTCERVAAGEPPHSQRATALLALGKGATQMQAAEQAGLTKGQVRYWLGKFRQQRLAIFPEDMLASPKPEPAAEPSLKEVGEAPAPDQEEIPSAPVLEEEVEEPEPVKTLEPSAGEEKTAEVSGQPAAVDTPKKKAKKSAKSKIQKGQKGKKGGRKKKKTVKSQPDKGKSKSGQKNKSKKKDKKKSKKSKQPKKDKKSKKAKGDKKKSKG